jgi:CMP-N-acetylneuraminic acid synthetase
MIARRSKAAVSPREGCDVMNVLAVIVARGGSKGLPGKNIQMLGDKPMLAWSILAAQNATRISRLIVSTDNPQIAAVARQFNAQVPFQRPDHLATDEASSVAVVLHAVEWMRDHEHYVPDAVMLLQPTTPFRTAQDIDHVVAMLEGSPAQGVVSVYPVKLHPFWMKTMDPDGRLRDLMVPQNSVSQQRQGLPKAYAPNGAIYLTRTGPLLEHKTVYVPHILGYVMPPERSMDIDSAWDLAVAQTVANNPALRGDGPPTQTR